MRSLYAKKPSLTSSIVDILQTSILVLTKLKAWYASEVSEDPLVHMRTRAHLIDIMVTLQWPSNEQVCIDFDGFPEAPKKELLRLLYKLYPKNRQARPYLAATLSWRDMRDVLCSPR
ncbi:hypothetical protein N7471_012937 [Penicillium samsonianum]|uniref:uncharacterized protein n=1 Tax=Penicillium samsonianum TaxID=1882272 RepID=UPI002549BDFA|nr:uncharacterized protein N7471_012937 [Penicillium samsonianum]KAJ6125620.1 hypothetical protein N7471_012937 [Penicillium samsonianum]